MKTWALLLVTTCSALSAGISLTCAWTPSTDPTCKGYNIYYGAQSRVYTNKVNAGNTTAVTISNLPNIKLFFAATAYDLAGLESDFSSEAVYTPPTNPPPPKPASNIQVK